MIELNPVRLETNASLNGTGPVPQVHLRLTRSRNGGNLYRGTPLTRNSAPLGPYSGNMPRALWLSGWRAVSYERGTPVLQAVRQNDSGQAARSIFFALSVLDISSSSLLGGDLKPKY